MFDYTEKRQKGKKGMVNENTEVKPRLCKPYSIFQAVSSCEIWNLYPNRQTQPTSPLHDGA